MLGKALLTVWVIVNQYSKILFTVELVLNGFSLLKSGREMKIKNKEKASEIDSPEAETTNSNDEILDRIKEFKTTYETKTEALKADKKLGENAKLKAT